MIVFKGEVRRQRKTQSEESQNLGWRSCVACAQATKILMGVIGDRHQQIRSSKMIKKLSAILAVLTLVAASAFAQDWDRAVSLFNQKQYRQAAAEFHAVLKANPSAWQSWYYIGFSHYQLQGYENTIDAFQNYIKAGEKDDKAQITGYYFIGFSQYQLKQYDKAIPSLT